MTHKPDHTKRNRVNKQERHRRKVAKRKMQKGLTKDPRAGYKKAR